MITIGVQKRQKDFVAYLNNDARYWASGQSEREAIGALLLTHGSRVGVGLYNVSDCPVAPVAGVTIAIKFAE